MRKSGNTRSARPTVTAAQADVARLAALEGYKRIVAPFDGVVTARNVDVGALVNSTPTNSRLGEFGGSGTPSPLFEVADIHEMRVYVAVPQSFSAQIHDRDDRRAQAAPISGPAFRCDGRDDLRMRFPNSRARYLSNCTATISDGMLQPGSFVEVHFDLPANSEVLRIPASALIFPQEPGRGRNRRA